MNAAKEDGLAVKLGHFRQMQGEFEDAADTLAYLLVVPVLSLSKFAVLLKRSSYVHRLFQFGYHAFYQVRLVSCKRRASVH